MWPFKKKIKPVVEIVMVPVPEGYHKELCELHDAAFRPKENGLYRGGKLDFYNFWKRMEDLSDNKVQELFKTHRGASITTELMFPHHVPTIKLTITKKGTTPMADKQTKSEV